MSVGGCSSWGVGDMCISNKVSGPSLFAVDLNLVDVSAPPASRLVKLTPRKSSKGGRDLVLKARSSEEAAAWVSALCRLQAASVAEEDEEDEDEDGGCEDEDEHEELEGVRQSIARFANPGLNAAASLVPTESLSAMSLGDSGIPGEGATPVSPAAGPASAAAAAGSALGAPSAPSGAPAARPAKVVTQASSMFELSFSADLSNLSRDEGDGKRREVPEHLKPAAGEVNEPDVGALQSMAPGTERQRRRRRSVTSRSCAGLGEDGARCGIMHLRDSPFCHLHKGLEKGPAKLGGSSELEDKVNVVSFALGAHAARCSRPHIAPAAPHAWGVVVCSSSRRPWTMPVSTQPRRLHEAPLRSRHCAPFCLRLFSTSSPSR